MRGAFWLAAVLLVVVLAGWAWHLARKYAARRHAESARAAQFVAEVARAAAAKRQAGGVDDKTLTGS